MDLETFVKETLLQIVRGIEGASAELKDTSAKINPENVQPLISSEHKLYGYYDPDTKNKYKKPVQTIEFDVAVYASQGTKTKGGIAVMVGALGLGSSGESRKDDGSHSRIKFGVPVLLPTQK